MTIEHIYRCNLCRDQIKPSEMGRKDGFGVYFTGDEFVFKRVGESSHHICLPCAKSTHDELRKVLPASDFKGVKP